VDGAGHEVHLDRPKAVADAIVGCLDLALRITP
jgi:pimeloyl-ACP methyl ester carboxylesterase